MASVALVVDDDPAICELIAEALREHGISVECVCSDTAAYKRVASLPTLSAVVIDVNLGSGTTGFDVARFARQVIPEVAVFYISGEVTASSFLAFGVPDSEFVEKPFTPHRIGRQVSARLQQAGR